ncbi:hypothetical protein HGRIS_000642 [Hohenbuehelia grisea]|uniref:PLAC8 family-domain-containing protein n=1 Tax=Hohenbuehelia grisea TaxID=104357 RepID=A0ABR3JSZ8_9AGAR
MSNQIYTQATQPPNAYNPYQQQQPSPQHQSPYGAPPQQFNQQPPQQQFQSPQSPPQSYMAEKATPPMQYQQPQPMQGMTVAPGGGNRNVKNLPMDGDGREWSHGLCDCCSDAGTCILAWCCPCIVYAQNKQRYEYLTSRGIPDPERGGSGCTGDCWVHGLITGCFGLGWVMQVSLIPFQRPFSVNIVAAWVAPLVARALLPFTFQAIHRRSSIPSVIAAKSCPLFPYQICPSLHLLSSSSKTSC